MIEIRPLACLSPEQVHAIGGGYTSPARYIVRKDESPERTTITLELVPLDSPYVKRWDQSDEEEWARYQQFVHGGYSLGAYEGDRLVGLALNEPRRWNNSLKILMNQSQQKRVPHEIHYVPSSIPIRYLAGCAGWHPAPAKTWLRSGSRTG